jgi:DNA (cytosine-5)-methyltransferase 1
MFSGIGGFDLAFRNQGHEIVGACEIDEYARRIYRKQFPGVTIHNDATDLHPQSLPHFDVLCAGFPCQAFSVAGKRLGFDEARGTLFFEIARVAKEKHPRYLLLENVRGLLSHDKGETIRTIFRILDEMGYDAEWQIINSKYFVPQNRERIYIIGHLRGERTRQVFPIISESDSQLHGKQVQKPGRSGSHYLWKVDMSESTRRDILNRYSVRRMTPMEYERLQGFPDNWTEGISDTQRYKCCGNAVTVPVIEYIITNLRTI